MGKGEGGELEIHEKKKSWEPRIERVTGGKRRQGWLYDL